MRMTKNCIMKKHCNESKQKQTEGYSAWKTQRKENIENVEARASSTRGGRRTTVDIPLLADILRELVIIVNASQPHNLHSL